MISPEWGKIYQPRATPWEEMQRTPPNTSPERAIQRTYNATVSNMFGIEVFCFEVRGDAVRPYCCAISGLKPGWRPPIPGRCPGLVCSGPSGRVEVITARACRNDDLREPLARLFRFVARYLSRNSNYSVVTASYRTPCHAKGRAYFAHHERRFSTLQGQKSVHSEILKGEKGFCKRLRNYAVFWIPAFAGMTYAGIFQTSSK